MANQSLVGWTALTEGSELVALYSLKAYTRNAQPPYLLAGMAVYAATGYLLTRGIEAAGVGVANGLWNAFSNVAGAIIGISQGEQYKPHQWVGLGLGIVSAVLLSIN